MVVLVPQVAKDIAGRTSDQPAGALAIEVPKSAIGPTRVLNVPNQPAEASAGAPKVPEISAIDYNSSGRAVLSGRAPGGARLFVYVDNEPIGEAVADEDGLWSFTPADGGRAGTACHPGRSGRRDRQGAGAGARRRSSRRPSRWRPRRAAPGPSSRGDATSAGGDAATARLVGGRIVVQPGNSLWKLARESYGQGVRYTVIYEANKDQITNPT